jgi:hypothetical protein
VPIPKFEHSYQELPYASLRGSTILHNSPYIPRPLEMRDYVKPLSTQNKDGLHSISPEGPPSLSVTKLRHRLHEPSLKQRQTPAA